MAVDKESERATAAPTHVVAADVATETGCSYPPPFDARMGQGHWRRLGEIFGLTQFGFNLETLQPGAQSSLRHWHTLNDEFLYVLEGQVTLITDAGATTMRAGTCVGFKAGVRNAHHFINRSQSAVHYLIVGSRVAGDQAFYPDDDLMWIDTADESYAAHKDGSRYG
jgi:uncharacterized cupin superfamily protein